MAEVKQPLYKSEFYLFVLDLMKKGYNPSQIATKLNKSKQLIYHYTKLLQAQGLIKKVGYGTWELCQKEVKNHPAIPKKDLDNIRGHGFVFTLKIPVFRNWDSRREFLFKKGIDFIESDIANGSGLRIVLDDWKVWLFNRSIVFYSPKGFSVFGDSAEGSSLKAFEFCFKLVYRLERLFKVSLRFRGKYVVKVVKQHYADVKNALAKSYNERGKGLVCSGVDGQWLIIDNSLNLEELETVHGGTAVRDMDEVVKPFFNDLRDNDPPLNSELAEHIWNLVKVQEYHAENIKSHIGAIQKLGRGVDELVGVVKQLKKRKSI